LANRPRLLSSASQKERRLHHFSLAVVIATFGHESLYFPVISLLFPVPDPAISADVIVYTHFFSDFGCSPAPFTGIYRGSGVGRAVCATSITLAKRTRARTTPRAMPWPDEPSRIMVFDKRERAATRLEA